MDSIFFDFKNRWTVYKEYQHSGIMPYPHWKKQFNFKVKSFNQISTDFKNWMEYRKLRFLKCKLWKFHVTKRREIIKEWNLYIDHLASVFEAIYIKKKIKLPTYFFNDNQLQKIKEIIESVKLTLIR